MKRSISTVLILLVMVIVGAMFWVDLLYYTSPESGFIVRGTVWLRYAVVALPILMCLLGLRTVGPRAISVMRVKNKPLALLFGFAGVLGAGWGAVQFATSLQPLQMYGVVQGLLTAWCGVWMILVCCQLFTQARPSPTKDAIWGMLASLPFAMNTIYRILVRPSSLYRVGPLVRALAGLFVLLWFGMLLRALYIALPKRRVRWLYFFGVMTFLFSTCLELPQTLYTLLYAKNGTVVSLLESVFMAAVGLVAGGVSVAIAAQSVAPVVEQPKEELII